MASTANKIKQSKALRQMCVNQIDELKDFADRAANDATARVQFKMMFIQLESISFDFKKHHQNLLALMALQDEEIDVEEAIRKQFEFNCSYVSAINYSLFDIKSAPSTSNLATRTNSNVKLPKVEVPKFTGDMTTFRGFIDMFNSVIHNNTTISDIEKFNYLISSLSGPPLALVQRTKLAAENYDSAYTSLLKRYNKKRVIAFAHLQAIDDAPFINNSKQYFHMRNLVDIFSENLAALKNMNYAIDDWDFLLYYSFAKHLDEDTLTRYQLEVLFDDQNEPTFESLMNFVCKQCDATDDAKLSVNAKPQKYVKPKFVHNYYQKNNQTSSFFANRTNKLCCSLCKADHMLFKCTEFHNKSVQERLNFAKQYNLCTNCLSAQHQTKECKSLSTCRKCNLKHHSLLHLSRYNNPAINHYQPATDSVNIGETKSPENYAVASTSQSNNFCGMISSSTNVLLSTAIVEILDTRGNYQKVRVLLDSGSQTTYISHKCFAKLGLTRTNCSFSISGLSTMQTLTSLGATTCTIKPVGKTLPNITFDCVILQKICADMPNALITNSNWSHLVNVNLADPTFYKPSGIDLLLGADVFPHIVEHGRLVGSSNEPIALNTIFGWILMGKFQSDASPPVNTTSLFTCIIDNDLRSLDKTIKRFWEIEEVPVFNSLSPEDELCESIFNKTHIRNESGRYVVELPFKETAPIFDYHNSRSIALRRFYTLEQRLIKMPDIYRQYSDFIQEYLTSDYLELISNEPTPESAFYIPHHCVLKPSSSTTKLRVVFDASTKTSQGSLNDHLLCGPKLQKDIISILLKFRMHPVAFTCDIKGMFSQILVAKKHQNYQRILWRFSQDEPVKDFRLKRVSFGLKSSPFLANRTIIQLACDERSKLGLAAQVLESDIYIDDIVTGCSSLKEAKLVRDQLIHLLKLGGFELRKWACNVPELLSDLPDSHAEVQNFQFDENSENLNIKILGLQWCPSSDNFSYKIQTFENKCTKRSILSEIARIFDPIGFLAPLTFLAKYLIQQLWSLGLDWDDQPPSAFCSIWLKYKTELSLLSKFTLPRYILFHNFEACQLHLFCDASEKGMACVCYFRVQKDNYFDTFFITAKSKVAPLKKISVPRLELSAAVLLSDLLAVVLKTFNTTITFSKIYAWSDSSIALTWIKTPPHKWKTFIANRVAKIQENVSPASWHHVQSADNPADCASRGLLPSELLENKLWWAGPAWLKLPQECWPVSKFKIPDQLLPEVLVEERKTTLTTFITPNCIGTLLNKYSSLLKIEKVLCHVNRFVYNCRHPNDKKTGMPNTFDINDALYLCVKYVQQIHFSEEISKLKKGQLVSKFLRKLNAFLDDQGILRVGGRLYNSELEYDEKHPAILPRNDRLTDLIIQDFHDRNMHPGAQTLHFLLRQQFWILSQKNVIRKFISKCLKCWRLAPKTYQPPMGNLPSLRVSQIKPFSCVGLDYAGPLPVTLGRLRGATTYKSYICIFVCFATKAIHLELVSNLSSEAFIGAFRRFVARRGRCSKIYSDCGTNFVGANKQIQNLLKASAEHEHLQWHFNPPSAPHFSGLAEAGVKSVKTHLYRVIGNQILSFEELYTVLVQVEAVLNSRPLYPMSSDPNDLSVLTPGHFLTLEPLTAVPDPDVSHLNINRLNRWQLVQKFHQDFWSRWHREYLHTLQQRGKWLKPMPGTVPLGGLVLIKDELSPPLKWHLGRIQKLHYGSDGIARVATIFTKQGTLKRPLVKLCPLPNSQTDTVLATDENSKEP